MGLLLELRRRNVFRVAIAYIIIAWLILQVGDTLAPALHLAEWVNTVLAFFLILGFPLALVFAWAFEITPEGLKKEKDVDRSESISHITGRKFDYLIIAVLALALGYFAFDKFVLEPSRDAELVRATTRTVTEQVSEPGKSETAEKSIAVLPFVNMSDDPGNEYFSDGISEELLNVLVKVNGLKVASRTSSFAFKNKEVSISDIARELKVDHVLEGSVRKAGNTVRVTAQLIDVRTDRHRWSATYDRNLEDIFAIQSDIAGQIVRALKVTLMAGEQEVMAHAQKPAENLEAYELYLRGRYAWQRRSEDSMRRAINLFEEATTLDPQLARAWSSLAAAHTTLPSYSDAPSDEHYPLAVSAAQHALMLDDSLAEAHAVLGDMARVDRKWGEAEAYYLRAIASEPKNSTAHLWYAEHLVMVGRLHDALEESLIAVQLDPLHPATNKTAAGIYLWSNDIQNALKYGAAARDLGHRSGLYFLAMANAHLGEFNRAIELAEQLDELRGAPRMKLFIEAQMDPGKRPLFFKMVAEQEMASSFIRFIGYTSFGRVDDAYQWANMNRNPARFTYLWVIWRPTMAPFRQDPRFAELVTELGLLDYWREHGWPDACQPVGDSVICE